MPISRTAIAGGLAGAVLMLSAGVALATPGQATASVNVRSGPSTSYGVVDSLYPGENVDVQQCRGSWCYVEHSGPDGWVSANYLSTGEDNSAPPPVYYEDEPPPVYYDEPVFVQPPIFYGPAPYQHRRPPFHRGMPPNGGQGNPPPFHHNPPPGSHPGNQGAFGLGAPRQGAPGNICTIDPARCQPHGNHPSGRH